MDPWWSKEGSPAKLEVVHVISSAASCDSRDNTPSDNFTGLCLMQWLHQTVCKLPHYVLFPSPSEIFSFIFTLTVVSNCSNQIAFEAQAPSE